jgi:hypothetical protein
VGKCFCQNLEPVPTTQVVRSTWTFAEHFFCPASRLERAVNHGPFLNSQLAVLHMCLDDGFFISSSIVLRMSRTVTPTPGGSTKAWALINCGYPW